MDAIYFYCFSSITLDNIKDCATKADYHTVFQDDDISNNINLYIAFKSQTEPPYKAYWRWEHENINFEDIDFEEKVFVKPIWRSVQSVFTLWFSMGALDEFVEMMSHVFECYDGYIFFEDALFNKDNIASIGDHIPPIG